MNIDLQRLLDIENTIKGLQAEREIIMCNIAQALLNAKNNEINNTKQRIAELEKKNKEN